MKKKKNELLKYHKNRKLECFWTVVDKNVSVSEEDLQILSNESNIELYSR